jgi:4-amino-4-deoxy-L-arabinose transferase-like glycosyltransferase
VSAFVVRALLPLAAYVVGRDAGVFSSPDTAGYSACAESLIRNGAFAIGDRPELARTPGFPVFLIPGIIIGHPVFTTVFLQVVLGCVTVWLAFRLTMALGGTARAALFAALLLACEPLSVLYPARMLSETLFTALFVAFLYAYTVASARGSERAGIAAAVLLSAATYVRPITYWLPLVTAFLLFLYTRKAIGGVCGALKRSLVFVSICVVLTGIWQARNAMETGFNGFSTIGDMALYYYCAAAVAARVEGIPYYEVQKQFGYYEPAPAVSDDTGRARARKVAAMRREAVTVIRDYPGVFAAIYGRGILRMMFDPGAVDYLKLFGRYKEGSGLLGRIVDRGAVETIRGFFYERPLLFWANTLFGGVLLFYLCCAAGGIINCIRYRVTIAMIVVPALYIVAMSGGPHALGRFRMPLMPVICVFAGVALGGLSRCKGD